MRASIHIAASAAAGAGSALALGPGFGTALFVAGGFLDVDHLELFIQSGLPARPAALVEGLLHNEEGLENRFGFSRFPPRSWAFPVLHSLELGLLCTALGILLGEMILLGIAAGLLLHILMDIRNYPLGLRFFSLALRGIERENLMRAWKSWKARTWL